MTFRKLFKFLNKKAEYKYSTSVQIHPDVNKIIKDLNKKRPLQPIKNISKIKTP